MFHQEVAWKLVDVMAGHTLQLGLMMLLGLLYLPMIAGRLEYFVAEDGGG
jgi:hypothetical protein